MTPARLYAGLPVTCPSPIPGNAAQANYVSLYTSHWNDRQQQRQGSTRQKRLSKTPGAIDALDATHAPQRIQSVTGVLAPEKQKPHEERRACTYATFL